MVQLLGNSMSAPILGKIFAKTLAQLADGWTFPDQWSDGSAAAALREEAKNDKRIAAGGRDIMTLLRAKRAK